MTLLRCLSYLKAEGLIELSSSKSGTNIKVGLQLDHLTKVDWSKTDTKVGSQLDHNGIQNRPLRPNRDTTLIEKNKKEEKEGSQERVLTEKDFDHTELPFFQSHFSPFNEKKNACIAHLQMRGFTEHAIAQLLEKVIYPNEYGYRRPKS